MITPNELRISNFIYSKYLKANHKVTGLILKDDRIFLYTDLQESYSDLEDWEPVPLTPEIFKKCGFNKNNKLFIEDWNLEYEFDDQLNEFKIWMTVNGKELPIAYYRYLHQFQNLYFALIGEELQIKL